MDRRKMDKREMKKIVTHNLFMIAKIELKRKSRVSRIQSIANILEVETDQVTLALEKRFDKVLQELVEISESKLK
jgi:hypothetical protein|tara:strand:+ start:103 stop:327 length:225 start_codon:yes stop_codon:yes gene_type:complete